MQKQQIDDLLLRSIFVASVMLVGLIDLLVWNIFGVEYTLSHVLRRWSIDWPILPYIIAFAGGLIFGHIFLR